MSSTEVEDDLLQAAPELHRAAVILTGDADLAVDVVAEALAGVRAGSAASDGPDALITAVVRAALRRAPRRTDRPDASGSRDAGTVLAGLSPRARAAATLRLVHRWDEGRTARALGTRPARVAALVPAHPDLARALDAVADRHGLPADEVVHAVRAALPHAHPAPRGRRRRLLLVAAVLLAALLVGYAVTQDPADDSVAQADGGTGQPWERTRDFAEAGVVLDDEGVPAQRAAGLFRREWTEIDYRERTGEITWSVATTGFYGTSDGAAAFTVLWCDMPPAQDANITAPAATLRVDGEEAVVTCAGKQGGPPVSVFTPLPSSATATVELTGDLPPTGSAVLGIYEEALGDGVPIRRERLPDAVPPPVPTDAVAITPDHPGLNHPMSGLERYVRAVEIGHDTQLQVWAGQTGGVAVHVDGFPVTDDGDVPFMRELFTAEVVVDGSVSDPSPAPQLDWRDQDPHLRQGTWVVQVPGDLRTFPVPEGARPAPGERRIVSVEVMSQSLDGLVQAVASDAAPGPAAQEVTALASGDPELGTVPEFAHGFALRAAWPIPQDGLTRAVPGGDLPDDVRLLVLTEDSHLGDWWSPQSSTGAIERGGRMDLLTIEPAPESLTAQMWFAQPFPLPDDVQDSAAPSRLGELRIALPPVPGHPSAHLLAYEQVAFEDFDFTDAPAPQSSRLLGDDAQTPDRVIDTLTRDDLDEHGRARVEVPGGASLGFEVTAAGRGELRVLVDGEPLPGTESRDGWWSTWTEQEVSVALHTEQTFSGSVGGADDVVVEIEVRGYAELLTVELVDTRYG